MDNDFIDRCIKGDFPDPLTPIPVGPTYHIEVGRGRNNPSPYPIVDIQNMYDAMGFGEYRINTIIMSRRVHYILLRRGKTKRQFRRWRGKMKAARRLTAARR